MRSTRLCVLALGLAFSPAAIAGPPAGYDLAAAFSETDTDKDGSIGIDEFFDRMIEIYFHGDVDKNGRLSPEEFAKAVVVEQAFAEVDVDADGAIDRREFVRARLPLFQEADTDRDGALSLAEVKAAAEGRPAE